MKDDKQKTLENLRDAGVVHLVTFKKIESEDRPQLEEQFLQINRAISTLSVLPDPKPEKQLHPTHRLHHHDLTEANICEKVLYFAEHIHTIKNKLKEFRKEEEALVPWGNFDQKLIHEIESKGLNLYFCTGGKDKIKKHPKEAVVEVINDINGKYYYVLVSEKRLHEKNLRIENAVKKSPPLTEIRSQIDMCKKEIDEATDFLSHLKPHLNLLFHRKAEIQEKIELSISRNSMSSSGEIAYIQGFVPVEKVEELKKNAILHKWGLFLQEPAKDDIVPTLIKTHKCFEMARPILDFVGVLPGYREWDICSFLLIFFTIFFAMIVNDGGYGLIFLALALPIRFIVKSAKAKNTVNLFIFLSLAAVGWGLLTGNFFGISHKYLPAWMCGIKALSDESVRDKNVQYLCFMLAAFHLSGARVWKAFLNVKSKKALGEIGWAMLLWANFYTAVELIVFKGFFQSWVLWLYIVGFLLILIFYVHWSEIGEVFMFPLHLMGSIVDVLSYIRLFALGVAGFYIAESFNEMGLLLYHSLPHSMIIIVVVSMSLVFLLGHLLNIGLAMIAVLVHDIRLNTLEFSNHMNLQWTGIQYKPFKKLTEKKQESV